MKEYVLHEAVLQADIDAVKKHIQAGVSLNELDAHGHSPLHWAVFGGYEDIVKVLLEAGANPNIISDDGVTPKWRARDFGLTVIEEMLTLFGGRIDTNDSFNRTAFQIINHAIGLPLPEEEKEKKNDIS